MVEIYEDDLNPLLNSFNEGVCCINAQGELIRYNKVAQNHWNLAQPYSHNLTSQSPIIRALAGESVYHEVVHVGEHHVLLVNALPLYSGTSSIRSIVIISQNVSEHVSMQQHAQIALNVMMEATLATMENEDIDEALRRVAVLIPQLEGVDNSIALRIDEATGRLIPLAFFGSHQQNHEAWQAELTTIEMNTENTIQSSIPAYIHTLRLARPLMFDFTATPPTYSNPRNLYAAIYAPVLLNGHVVGLLGAERHSAPELKGLYFPQWSVDLLAALARLVSISAEKNALLDAANRSQKELEAMREVLRQKEDFLLLAAHELKNPLTAIRGQAQVMRRRLNQIVHHFAGDAEDKHDLLRGLNSIIQQTRKIEHMINTLLEVSRVDLDRLELEMQDIDLVQLVTRTLKEYLPLAPNHELRLLINGELVALSEDATPTRPSINVHGDEHRLEQVVTNLVGNAIKYSAAGTPVIVSLRHTSEGDVELSVEDRGIGVPLEEQARLTERYYRAENARTISTQGLGLGLYLVNALVAGHGGSLAIKSEGVPGKGSIFSVRLPVQGHR